MVHFIFTHSRRSDPKEQKGQRQRRTRTNEQVGKGSKRCSDVRSAVNRGHFWSADLGFATMYGMRVKEMCMSLMRHEAGGLI